MRGDGARLVVDEADVPRPLRRGLRGGLVFDNRGGGESGTAPGKPRHEIDPWEQIRDYQHAITCAQNRPEVDPDRIGVWGTSFSAAHAFVVAAIDRRVKAASGQAPFISGRATYANLARVDNLVVGPEVFTADRRARAAGEPPTMIPVIGDAPGRLVGYGNFGLAEQCSPRSSRSPSGSGAIGGASGDGMASGDATIGC